MLPEQTSILIVGAGPTGLSAAVSLLNQGCKDILIVDAAERSPDTSRAMAIHAATLEVRLKQHRWISLTIIINTGTRNNRLRR